MISQTRSAFNGTPTIRAILVHIFVTKGNAAIFPKKLFANEKYSLMVESF
jgi:hypothetical protein